MPINNICQMCGGMKKIPCTKCRATGQQVNKKDVNFLKREWCTTCNRTGWLPCPECVGKGEPRLISYIK